MRQGGGSEGGRRRDMLTPSPPFHQPQDLEGYGAGHRRLRSRRPGPGDAPLATVTYKGGHDVKADRASPLAARTHTHTQTHEHEICR